ncbi:MAG: FeS cluster assembly protein SufB [Chlamydiae bacterium]|nr:FeS cluster assembly protein SufB [Chlamydiota bacterium]
MHAMTTLKKTFEAKEYLPGFKTNIASNTFAKGLNEEVIKKISQKKKEPLFMLEFRQKAYQIWKSLEEPTWANLAIDPIDYQDMSYYSEPKKKQQLNSLDEVDPELLKTLEKLGIPIEEQKMLTGVAIDVVFDSVSLGVTFQKKLKEAGVILCSISEAIQKYPDLIQKYLASVVPMQDNFFAALNAAVFSDGSFVYVPKGVKCPMELSTYFRINERNTGQFERTLIIAEENSCVSYLEGCTAPAYDNKQLHAAVVELVALDGAKIKYSTVQNWYPGDPKTGKGGIYNFVTKRGLCKGKKSHICWTQVEVGAAITWKYPSCILQGDESSGEFYSVALTNGKMQADTGTKMLHIGKKTTSTIISKGISAENSKNTYRGQVMIHKKAKGARNYTQCDSMLVGNKCSANTFPSIDVANSTATVEHEASTSKMNEEQIFYLQSRGIAKEEAIELIVNGFCKEVMCHVPLEFAKEAQKLLTLKLEGSIG